MESYKLISVVFFANRDGLNYTHNCIMLLSRSRMIHFPKDTVNSNTKGIIRIRNSKKDMQYNGQNERGHEKDKQ